MTKGDGLPRTRRSGGAPWRRCARRAFCFAAGASAVWAAAAGLVLTEVAGAGFALAGAASAQAPPAEPEEGGQPRPGSPLIFADRSGDVARSLLREAENLLRAGRAPEAVPILERLNEERPGDSRVLVLLTQAYLRSGKDDEAIALCRAQAEATGDRDPHAWMQLARCCIQAGRGREAVEALLGCLRDRPSWVMRLVDPLELAVSDSLAGSEAMAALEAAVAGEDAPAAWKEALGHIYATTGREPEAVALLVEADRAQERHGELLLPLARTLSKRGVPGTALAAYDSVLALDPQPGTAEDVWFEKAELLASLDRPREAVEAYAEGERLFPRGPLALRAAIARADLLMGPLRDLEAARQAYETVLAAASARPRRERQQALVDRARLALAECALRGEDFTEAARRYEELAAGASQSALREQAAFQLAEMLFFDGKFQEAEEAYYRLTDQYPQGAWVNDAFRRVLLLGETQAGPGVLDYARTEYLRSAGRTGEALARCREGLAGGPGDLLRAELRFQELRLVAALGDWAAADSSLARLIVEESTSRVAPAALLWMGEQAEAVAQRHAQAAACYERVLLEYPSSFEARRARARLRALRSEDS